MRRRAPACAARRASLALTALAALLLSGCGSHLVVLHPVGPVAQKELDLVIRAAIPMAVVFLLVITLFAIAVIRFRDRPGNTAPYLPNWEGNRLLELVWFAIPILIVAFIAVPTVRTTFALNKVPAAKDPLVIDVTSLDWKWLFQYPSQQIATVNHLEVPTGQPLLFELTADGPMNTFWLPQLGGMEYTMPGRVLPLWLQVDKAGAYWGRSGNFSGVGFAKMQFQVQAVSPSQFTSWAAGVKQADAAMSQADYQALRQPGLTGDATYGGYPAGSFPTQNNGFSLAGSMYTYPQAS